MPYDPRDFGGTLLPTSLPTQYKVEGYDDDGSCHVYPPHRSYAAALRQARRFLLNGDANGVRYQHYVVLEFVRSLHMTLSVHDVSSPA